MDTSAINDYSSKIIDLIISYAPDVIAALAVLIIGLWVIKIGLRMMKKVMEQRDVDVSLQSFLESLVGTGFRIMLVLSVAGMLGIETTSFIAIIGAAGLAVGLALQGTLANFAGGVLILLFKPYKVGDLISAQGHTGWVQEIQIFVTTLKTPDSKIIIVPNGAISNGDITNLSIEGKIRVDLVIGISYDSNIKQAREVLLKVMNDHPKVLKDPAPFVGVWELADSAVSLAVQPHCTAEDYWDVYFDIQEAGKEALDAANISIPFPQMNVHMQQS